MNTKTRKQAMTILVPQADGTYRLGDWRDIIIGQRVHMMLMNGDIILSSVVEHYIANVNGLEVITERSTYDIVCTNVRV